MTLPTIPPRAVELMEIARSIGVAGWYDGFVVVSCPRCSALCGCRVGAVDGVRYARVRCPLCGTSAEAIVGDVGGDE